MRIKSIGNPILNEKKCEKSEKSGGKMHPNATVERGYIDIKQTIEIARKARKVHVKNMRQVKQAKEVT